jgi:DNA repair protein RadC
VDDPAVAAAALSHELMWQTQERFAILLLDVKHRLIGTQIITIGTATETLAHPRDIFREVLRQGATRAIVAHNHPSGNVEPSPEDISLTRQLLAGAHFLSLPILDHLILGNGNFASCAKRLACGRSAPRRSRARFNSRSRLSCIDRPATSDLNFNLNFNLNSQNQSIVLFKLTN